MLEDLAQIEDDSPLLVDGPQLLPELVASRGAALFVVAAPALQRELVTARGSNTYARTRDPERALENRLARDAILADRLRCAAAVIEIGDVRETEQIVASFVEPLIHDWIENPDHGAVGRRRCDENDARLRQIRAHLDATGGNDSREVELACECARPGCAETVRMALLSAETSSRPFVAPDHG
ncbi:MAG TPA: hypothetical protein VKP14_00085 [Gaiellaceae bacterium]|nr:hypothetical protein [Gaiellaceae bacterium]